MALRFGEGPRPMQARSLQPHLQLPVDEVHQLCDAIDGVQAISSAMAAIDAARRAWLGEGLLTVNLNLSRHPPSAGPLQLQRLWSSNVEAYPVGGRKSKPDTPWVRRLFEQQEIFEAEGEAAMTLAFDDFALMSSLGLRCALNVPVVRGRTCVATFNFMSPCAHWTPGQTAVVRLLATFAMPCILQEVARLDDGAPDLVPET